MEKTAELELGSGRQSTSAKPKIANEDILFLREDLIEELEEFDLLPVKTETQRHHDFAQQQKAGAPYR